MKSSTIWPVSWKTIRYSRPERSDTLCWSKLLENHTLHSATYPYSPCVAVSPPPRDSTQSHGLKTSFMSPRERENANPSFHWMKPLVTTIYPVVVTDLSNCSRCNLVLSQNIAQKSIVTMCVLMFYFGFILTHLCCTVSIESAILFSFMKSLQSSSFSDFTSWK